MTAVTVLAVAAACMAAESSAKPLWLDELLTWATAAVAGPDLVWRSLRVAPLSLDPPLYHWMVHYSLFFFGDSAISIRLVSICGMLAALGLVYRFAAGARDRIAGLLAMSVMFASGAFSWGYEARPYSLVLAFSAGALVCWQNIVRDRSRRWSLVLFAACLAAADSCHYYSVLICVPFIAGELTRARRKGAIDWAVAAAMAAGNAIMLAFLPLIPATKAYQGSYYRGVLAGDVAATYRVLAGSPPSVAALLAGLAIALAGLYRGRKQGGRNVPGTPLPEETATLAGFALFPPIVFAFSFFVTHTYAERFALPAIEGLSLLGAFWFRRLQQSDKLALTAAALMACAAPVHAAHSLASGRGRQVLAYTEQASVFSGAPGARIVMTDVALYLTTLKYGGDDIRRRLVLFDPVATPTAADRVNTGQMMVLGVREGVRLPVVTAGDLRSLHKSFFLVSRTSAEVMQSLAGYSEPANAGRFLDWPVLKVTPVNGF